MSMTGISMLFSSLLVFCLISLIFFFGLILGGSRHRDKEGHRSHNMKFATGRDQMREQ